MLAFGLALEHGADGVELDVRMASDGVPVVIHDETLERTTSGAGRVADLTSAHLTSLDAGAGEGVPVLEDVAAWAAATGAWLNVEIKERGAEAASVAALRRHGMLERAVFSAFDPAVVETVGRVDAGVLRFLLTERWDPAAAHAAGACGAMGICLERDAATPDALRSIAGLGLPVIVWTVDDETRLRALLRAGVAAVISNVPGRAASIRRGAGTR
jgi:glycerophosphoryl diester phosphodiesterase